MQGEHKHIEEIQLTEENGLLIFFGDNSHTYIQPELLKDIYNEYINRKYYKVE